MYLVLTIVLIFANQGSEYAFHHEPDKRVTGFIGKEYCEGTIAADGSFVPDLSALPKSRLGQTRSGFMAPVYRVAAHANEQVYEYRSGYLIPMVFISKYELIPEVGNVIIDFKDYHYGPKARRIYNLPGRFELKNQNRRANP